MNEVLLIKKVRYTRNRWTWMQKDMFGDVSAPEGDLETQLGTIFEDLQNVGVVTSGASVLSPQLGHKYLNDFMVEMFPEDFFFGVNEHALNIYFDRALSLRGNLYRNSQRQSTLFIASDASSDNIKGQGHACWAWATENGENGYNFGYSGEQDINTTEFEGILNAIVDNRNTPHDRIHIYSDSANSVEIVNFDLVNGIIPREARKYGFVPLAQEAYEIMQERDVKVQWVRGHKNHRLNNAADVISRTVRKRYTAGYSRNEFEREVRAIHRVFATK